MSYLDSPADRDEAGFRDFERERDRELRHTPAPRVITKRECQQTEARDLTPLDIVAESASAKAQGDEDRASLLLGAAVRRGVRVLEANWRREQ